jgi:hypothetical protein
VKKLIKKQKSFEIFLRLSLCFREINLKVGPNAKADYCRNGKRLVLFKSFGNIKAGEKYELNIDGTCLPRVPKFEWSSVAKCTPLLWEENSG